MRVGFRYSRLRLRYSTHAITCTKAPRALKFASGVKKFWEAFRLPLAFYPPPPSPWENALSLKKGRWSVCQAKRPSGPVRSRSPT